MKNLNYTHSLSDISAKILKLGLPLILGYFLFLIISINSHSNTSKEVIIHIYLPWLEHIMMSLCILVLGAVIFDITKKELDIRNNS